MDEAAEASGIESSRRFAMLCLRARFDPAAADEARRLAENGALDWESVFELAAAERVAPLIHHLLRHVRGLPPAVAERFRQAYESTALQNAFLLQRLEQALRALGANAVPVLVLKGAVLAHAVYRNIALRPFGDLDLLVRRRHLDLAVRTLEPLGYAPLRAETRAGALAQYENEVALRKPGRVDVVIDLHWNLFDSPHYQAKLDLGWCWETAASTRIRGFSVPMLGLEAQLLHLCGHLVLHHQGRGLLWAHDIAELLAQEEARIDWPALMARAQALDLVLPLQQLLPRITADWQIPVPAPVLAALRRLRPSTEEQRATARLVAPLRSPGRRLWDDLATTGDWQSRIAFAWTNVFPSPAYMRQRYRIAHPVLLPLYYPYRWILGLRGLGQGS